VDSSDKKNLSERDICTRFITPAIIHTGSDQNHQIRENLIMHILMDGGRAAIVLPDGTLFSEGVKTRIKEFVPEKVWWTNRTENEHAWQLPVEQVIANGFNLDIKNPNVVPDELGDPVELLRQYEPIREEAAKTREVLKRELMASLGGER